MEGSRNAFAVPDSSRIRPSSVLSEQHSNARAPKRPRLSEDAVAAIHTQCAKAETSLEVDHMMLDYLAYRAIKACFASRKRDVQSDHHVSLSKSLSLADTFSTIFKSRHPTYAPDPELRFRILMLKLSTLVTQRFTRNPTTPSRENLEHLRRDNSIRSTRWMQITTWKPTADLPVSFTTKERLIPQDDLERNRAHVLHELGVPAEDEQYEDAYYGTRSSVSLLDILPLFMQLSAARNAMCNSNLRDKWMHLAGEFMVQACLEGYLVFGKVDVVDEAFSWGYLDYEKSHEAGIEIDARDEEVNAMFEDDEYAIESEGWKDVRLSYLKLLLRSSISDHEQQGGMIAHLETLAADHPLAKFEASLLHFLELTSNSFPEPVLAQLEKGRLDGMTEQETNDFLRDCGVGAAQFFETPAGFKAPVG